MADQKFGQRAYPQEYVDYIEKYFKQLSESGR